ncbi:PGAM-domain-containing protein [Aureobasidium sp. EXF-12298]|nr:PGAM-domain-containing protein [Aureobasidium sp. EXF-12298]KAI4754187.1 PGAM-domain-containing protein [Aureobasidium sp. EXF-12344]KAI4771323.1 PGAM-domain-containing protein [Aureobasidium sp. EXF-3400]
MPPKSLYFVRHAQGEHNAQHDDSIPDAVLTPQGKSQCRDLSTAFPNHESVSLIVSSPLRRALQTSVHAFAPALQRDGVKVLLQPMSQEMNAYACDIGTDRDELEKQVKAGELWDAGLNVPSEKVDFSLVEEGWNSKEGKWAPDRATVQKRAAKLRSWLFNRKEEVVVVVSHGGFLHALTEDWSGFVAAAGTGWQNCEIREFVFTEKSTQSSAHVVQRATLTPKPDGAKKEPEVGKEVEDAGLLDK